MDKKLTFHINNMAYSLNIDEDLEKDLIRLLPADKTLSTKELLFAYIRMTQEFKTFRNDIELLSAKLPKL